MENVTAGSTRIPAVTTPATTYGARVCMRPSRPVPGPQPFMSPTCSSFPLRIWKT
jgi:hypothetical protein